jgi:type IV secretory pathway VirB2 component (pilin)
MSVDLLSLGKGKLTYTLAVVAILWAAVGWIFGWLSQDEALKTIWVALAVFGIRRAIQ